MEDEAAPEDLTTARRISHVIFEHAARMSRESDISGLLQINADLARDLTGADRCSLWLLDEAADELWTKVAHGVGEIRIPRKAGVVGACVAENRIVIVNDAALDARFLGRIDQTSDYHTKSLLAVPLRADGNVIGALQVLNKPGGFSQHDADLLTFMAHYSAAEIQTERLRQEAEAAKLLRREMDLAREVQRNLLPHDARPVAGLDYAGFFQPARVVGGDYYDFLELPGGLFSVTLGDVSGKGIAAAVLMASIQTLLRSQLLQRRLPLSTLVAEVSQAVYLCSSSERYSTLFCGILDAQRRQLTYVNAGHQSPSLLRKNGQLERLGASGPPVGLFPSMHFDEATVPVNEGDLLLCISDGVSETVNAKDEMWDEREVDQVLLETAGASASEVIERIVQKVRRYSIGAEQFDDMTVAAVRIINDENGEGG